MATSMEADSEVLFKEKREGKGVKTETAVDDATLRFRLQGINSSHVAPGTGSGAPRRGRRGAAKDRAEEVLGLKSTTEKATSKDE